ncbi:MAG: TorF family putative porin [Dokdonella sp.]
MSPPVRALALALIACVTTATAQTTETTSPSSVVTGNIDLTSDYMFRGLTQTWGSPAVQGGADLALSNGFAAGLWGSSISGKSYPGASLELDLYASYGQSFNTDWSWRVGLYTYLYPKGNLDDVGLASRTFNTAEANAALTWKWVTLKFSRALTDYFGLDIEQGYRDDSRGTAYVQLDAAIPFNNLWSLALHAAYTDIATSLAVPLGNGASNPDYTDLGATLKFQVHPHWSASVGATYANNDAFYSHTASFTNAADTRNTGGTRGFVMLQGTF